MTPPDEVRDAVAAAIYETFPRIQAPESPAPKWVDCKPRYRREWYRCADAALAAADAAGWQLVTKEADEGILRVMDLCASGKVAMSKREAWRNMLNAAPKVTP